MSAQDLFRAPPPVDNEAEECLIGCLMRRPSIFPEVATVVRPETFGTYRNQVIYTGIADVLSHQVDIDQHAMPLEVALFIQRKYGDKTIQELDLGNYLDDVFWSMLSPHNWKRETERVVEAHTLRTIIYVCREILTDAMARSIPASVLLEDAELRLSAAAVNASVAKSRSFEKCIEDFKKVFAERIAHKCDPNAVKTGFIDLDIAFGGGLKPSEMIVIGGRPGQGKSALGMQIAMNFASSRENDRDAVMFVSLEMSELQLTERMISVRSGVPYLVIQNGSGSPEQNRIIEATSNDIRHLPIFISDIPGATLSQVTSEVRRMAMKHSLRLVVIDYLQLITEDKEKYANRQEQVSAISRGIRALANSLNIPIIALCQLNRQTDGREDGPRLSDLRESGAIEADANRVILINRKRENGHMGEQTDLVIAKNRGGPCDTITVKFEREFCRFVEYQPISNEWPEKEEDF